jgi:hypothetical protein
MVHGNGRTYIIRQPDREAVAMTSEDGVTWTRVLKSSESLPRPVATASAGSARIQPVPTSLTNSAVIIYLNGKGYELRLPANSRPVCYIQASTDLVQWMDVGVITNATRPWVYDDPDHSKFPMRFYRLMMQ